MLARRQSERRSFAEKKGGSETRPYTFRSEVNYARLKAAGRYKLKGKFERNRTGGTPAMLTATVHSEERLPAAGSAVPRQQIGNTTRGRLRRGR
jgi:hypothetical protein